MKSHSIILLVVLIATVAQVARVCSVSSRDGDTPFLSANDRSRWCTVASLVEDGGFEIDRILSLQNARGRTSWSTIDMVQHLGRDGKLHFYSSKPPLLSVMVAGVYYLIYQISGLRLTEHPFYVGRILLVIVNVLPLGVFWWCWMRFFYVAKRDYWSTGFLTAALLVGTFMTTFVVTLNNHLPAAIAAGFSLILFLLAHRFGTQAEASFSTPPATLQKGNATVSSTDMGERHKSKDGSAIVGLMPYGLVGGSGLASALSASFELPALSWFAILLLLVAWRLSFSAAFVFVCGAIPIGVLFFLTNYWAHGDWRPAYDHRKIGPQVASLPRWLEDDQPSLQRLRESWPAEIRELSTSANIVPSRFPGAWTIWDDEHHQRWILVDAATEWRLHQSDDWYDYPGSYWRDDRPRGVDRGESSRLTYALHVLVGHHGVFSLSPIWLLSLFGAFMTLRRSNHREVVERLTTAGIVAVSIACFTFYLTRPEIDRNYGGVSCCFRWAVWLSPLWLYLAHTVWDRMHGTGLRFVATTFLLVSILSSVYAWSNPWSHPWLFNFWSYLGWIHYP